MEGDAPATPSLFKLIVNDEPDDPTVKLNVPSPVERETLVSKLLKLLELL